METFQKWRGLLSDSARRKKYEDYVKAADKKIGAFVEFDAGRGAGLAAGGGDLAGVPFAVKDDIAVKGFRLCCGSKMLESFVSPYTASAVEKLAARGAVPVGKTNLDEFGMGASTETSVFGKTQNPWSVSGAGVDGAAAAAAAGMAAFALGSDAGGSLLQPAAMCGVYGLRPGYGVVSRHGLAANASSFDVIGVCARSVEITRAVFDIIRGLDEKDQSSRCGEAPAGGAKRMAVVSGEAGLDSAVEAACRKAAAFYKGRGFEVREVKLALADYYAPAYYTIAAAEAGTNLARYTGIPYGRRPEYAENPEELMRKARGEGFGYEAKLRTLLGTHVLQPGFQADYFRRALAIREAVRAEFDTIFSAADILLMPVFPAAAFPERDKTEGPERKRADRFTAAASLAGLPALSFPAALEGGLPVGMQLLAPAFAEERLFDAAKLYEEEFPCPAPGAYKPEWS